MIEKIKSYYVMGFQKKYFLLRVAVTIYNGKRTLMHAMAMPTDKKIKNLKRLKYDNADYAEFLLEAKEFFDLIFKREDKIIINDFIIPYTSHHSVDEYFIPTVEDSYDLKRPYNIFRIRIGGNPYCYGSLSHPDYPSYANCYDLIEEQIGTKLTPSSSVDFCVLFPIERARISNFKVDRNKFKFKIEGNLNHLICKYNIRTTKGVKRDELTPKENNIIKFKGKIIEFGLDLWYGNKKLDYVSTRHIDNSKLAKSSLYNYLDDNKDKSNSNKIFKKFIMNPWAITILGGVIVTILSYILFVK